MLYRMTIMAIETELNRNNKSIADSWTLENENFNADDLLYTIIEKGAIFEPVYANPDYFYYMCSRFWSKWKRTFEKWFDAFDIEYNPLENYDSTEHTEYTPRVQDTVANTGKDTETPSGKTTVSHLGKDTETPSGQTTVTQEIEKKLTETVETEVSAYDDSNYVPREKTTTTPGTVSGSSGKDTTTNTTSYNQAKTENDYNSRSETTYENAKTEYEHGHTITTSHTGKDETDVHRHGNIGVTTSQQMLKSELDIQAWNCYEHICDVFIKEMCVAVY